MKLGEYKTTDCGQMLLDRLLREGVGNERDFIKLFIVVFLLKIIRIVLHHTHAFKPKCPKQPVRTVPNAYCTLLQKSIP